MKTRSYVLLLIKIWLFYYSKYKHKILWGGNVRSEDNDYYVRNSLETEIYWKWKRFRFKRALAAYILAVFVFYCDFLDINGNPPQKYAISVEFTIYLDAAWYFLSLFIVPKCLNEKTHTRLQNLLSTAFTLLFH